MKKKTDNLWGQIGDELMYYKNTTLDLNPSFASTAKDIIELIEFYFVSKFRDGSSDANGFKKGFYNIVEHACQVAAKMIDLDTKDVDVIAEDGQSYYPSWLFERRLKLWMKEKKNSNGKTFGQFLNKLVFNYPKYGHIVVKKAGDTVHLVPMKNLAFMPEAESIMKSPYIIEEHEMTPWELETTAKERNWKGADKVGSIIKNRDEKDRIKIYERCGNTKLSEKWNYFIIAENSTDEQILHWEKIDRKDLYKELKWDSIDGRALGRGQVERLFENQIAKNLFENLLRTGLRWTSKKLYQTRDNSINKNLLTDVENGRVIIANQEITPIAVEERNLGAYDFADSKWDANTRNTGFVNEPLSGERPPSGTPLGTTILQTKQAGMYYELKREELGMFIKDILVDWILPSFKKEIRGIDKMMFGEFNEEQLETISNLLIEYNANKSIISQIKRTGRFPGRREIQMTKGIVAEQIAKEKELKIPKDYFKDIHYKIDIVITGESIDTTATVNALERILMVVGQNPTLLQDKNFRKLLYQEMDLLGISPVKFEKAPQELKESMTMAQGDRAAQSSRGGSVARVPGAQTAPMSVNNQTRI